MCPIDMKNRSSHENTHLNQICEMTLVFPVKISINVLYYTFDNFYMDDKFDHLYRLMSKYSKKK